MSSESDERRPSPAYRLVHHYRELAMAAVQRYNHALVAGQVSESITRELAETALNYYYALYEARDENALDEPWDERGIAWLEEAERRTVEVETDLPRANAATTVETQPAIMAADPEDLKAAILELNDVANELGLSLDVRESTPRSEITEEIMEDVEQWRQANLE